MVEWAFIGITFVMVVLLLVAMVYALKAANAAKQSPDQCKQECGSNSHMVAAIAGVAALVIFVLLIGYMMYARKEIVGKTASISASYAARAGAYSGTKTFKVPGGTMTFSPGDAGGDGIEMQAL